MIYLLIIPNCPAPFEHLVVYHYNKGAFIFYQEGASVCGGVQEFWGGLSGGQIFSKGPKRGRSKIFSGVKEGVHYKLS